MDCSRAVFIGIPLVIGIGVIIVNEYLYKKLHDKQDR